MTPADLRGICDSINGKSGTDGQSRLTRLLGWHYTTLCRKLNGKSPITQSDELAIMMAMEIQRPGQDSKPIASAFGGPCFVQLSYQGVLAESIANHTTPYGSIRTVERPEKHCKSTAIGAFGKT